MAASNTCNRQGVQDTAQAGRQAFMDSLRERAPWPRRDGDIPAQQVLYREAVALGPCPWTVWIPEKSLGSIVDRGL